MSELEFLLLQSYYGKTNRRDNYLPLRVALKTYSKTHDQSIYRPQLMWK